MLRKAIFLWIAIIFYNGALAKEPQNLAQLEQQIEHYYESGEYLKQITEQSHRAEIFMKSQILENKSAQQPKKLAMILDIDETALSNFDHMRKLNFLCQKNQLTDHLKKGNDPAIAPILNLYRYAKNHHVAVFFVTGRPNALKDITMKNLKNVGYYHWDGLVMKPDDYAKKSITPYKKKAREAIEDQGFTIIINIGDQLSDLDGGASLKTYKLPNPFYYLP